MAANKLAKRIAFIFLFLLGIVWIVPIFWLIINSFKYDSDFITSFANVKGPVDYLTRLWPRQWTVANYIEMFVGGAGTNTTANLLAMFKNSFIVAIAQTAGVLIITSLSAYAYERLNFKGGNAIFWALMYMSMFPNVVNLLPMFRIANALGWVNNLNALIWPGLAGVFNIFLIRNFMKGIPKALDEAATIDGANSLQVYTKIILPSILPVMIVVGLFAFNGAWNDFLWPTIVMTDVNNQTLTAGLRLLMGQYEQKWAHMIASCLVSMMPPFLLYLVAQKYFLQGISVQAGVKG
ncbi:ABC transporter permease subunit [Beduinella massiliensis]|uniref:ABC transporter permease subunit n=1 Tax=Beduinella massiliensis TaxID=1852363 RepID=UPI000C816B5D